jgi:hypothetical protein
MNLNELEARLQSIFEIEFPSLFPGKKTEDAILQKLAAAIHANTTPSVGGAILAPDTFTLILHPNSLEKWNKPAVLSALLHSITLAAQESGFQFIMSPAITISTRENLTEGDASVVASYRADTMAETNGTPLNTGSVEEGNPLPENAFLIIEGTKVFPLSQPVVNIGRRLDNHLVIDDPRVSRNHAQLRSIKGRFVVFDLNSTGGTFVNGQRASQSVLYPGDVISLAGVTVIFGQDNPPPRPDLKDTAPLQSSAADRRTAFIKDQEPNEEPDKKK